MKYVAAIGLCVAALVIFGLVILDLAYLFHGSLEMFPTAEDDESVRVFTITTLIALIPIGASCIFCAAKIWPSRKTINRNDLKQKEPEDQ